MCEVHFPFNVLLLISKMKLNSYFPYYQHVYRRGQNSSYFLNTLTEYMCGWLLNNYNEFSSPLHTALLLYIWMNNWLKKNKIIECIRFWFHFMSIFALKIGEGVDSLPTLFAKKPHNIVIQNAWRQNLFDGLVSPNFNLLPTLMTAKSL